MANMAYCRFRNTLSYVVDCIDHIDAAVSEEEHVARKRLVHASVRLLESAGVLVDEDSVKQAVAELDSFQ